MKYYHLIALFALLLFAHNVGEFSAKAEARSLRHAVELQSEASSILLEAGVTAQENFDYFQEYAPEWRPGDAELRQMLANTMETYVSRLWWSTSRQDYRLWFDPEFVTPRHVGMWAQDATNMHVLLSYMGTVSPSDTYGYQDGYSTWEEVWKGKFVDPIDAYNEAACGFNARRGTVEAMPLVQRPPSYLVTNG